MSALELEWAFGLNSNVTNCVHLLDANDEQDDNEQTILYPVSNYGVIYNTSSKKQLFLTQHTNIITACILSSDKQLFIFGDSGASGTGSMLSIWSSHTFELLSTHQLPPNFGVQCLAINHAKTLLSAIVNESIGAPDDSANDQITQHLMVWSLHTNTIDEQDDEQKKNENISADAANAIHFDLVFQQQIVCKPSKSDKHEPMNNLYHFITFNESSTEIVTHGQHTKNFIFWSIQSSEKQAEQHQISLIPYYVQPQHNSNNHDLSSIGDLTQSAFIPTEEAPLITATDSGDLIVWAFDIKKFSKPKAGASSHRIISKIISKIIRGGISCVHILNNNAIVLASSSGNVRFYDFEFRAIGWLDYLGDQVISISFPLHIPNHADLSNDQQNAFIVPNMIIATKNHKIFKVESPEQENALDIKRAAIVDTFNAVCTAMTSHPNLPYVAVGNESGNIQIWDIVNKTIVNNISFSQSHQVTDIKFSPNGEWMAFGTDSHYLRIYDTQQFQEQQSFKTGYNGFIKNLCFSHNGEWMALSQSNRISVYRFWYNINDLKKQKPKEWVLIGNYISHKQDIVGVHFAAPSGIDRIQQRRIPRLFSVGFDNFVNEYNLHGSSFHFGLRLKYTFHLTQLSTPTMVHFVPGIALKEADLMTYCIENDKEDVIAPKFDEVRKQWVYTEDLLMVFDDELKIHFYHAPRSIYAGGDARIYASDTQALNSPSRKREDEKEAQNEQATDAEAEDEEQKEIECLQFRRTVLGPSYGAPIKKIIPMENGKTYLFCTYDQVIGLMEAPFNGNPHRYFGCTAHPGQIHGFDTAMNGKYLITNGGHDKSMLIWQINADVLSKRIADCDEDNNLSSIYRALLQQDDPVNGKYLITNGGHDKSMLIWQINADVLSKQIADCDEDNNLSSIYRALLQEDDPVDAEKNLYEEITNYFHYVQIENQGALSTVPRSITGKINVEQIMSIFQAMGCFLTEMDVERIRKEIVHRFGYNHVKHDAVSIDLDQFIELFINYRSTFEISLDELHGAFERMMGVETNVVSRQQFMDILEQKGDKMSRDELMSCFETLTGYKRKQLKAMLPDEMNAEFFTRNILGFKSHQQFQ
eukprot:CAMPEP_0197077038 /NCGR_PEP_ID=MMETSP1384-20130603/212416_1 /TAXON_ID=29189 /ORGANISM="Ammonia sp." /LENGTH=1094 /DNA_ID=CAMNT_0042515897 /DNA_START=27 /DNA_END=3312 /DNA_ORIENTATION=+